MRKHGGYIYHEDKMIVDFSANIHPYGMPEEIYQAMKVALEESIHYPDPDCVRLKKLLAIKHNVSSQQVICGNGAADLIFRLALILNAKNILLPVPTFVEYEEAFSTPVFEKSKIMEYPLNVETLLIEEDILEYMNPEIDVLILCNPNNPTGRLINTSLLVRMLEKAKRQNIVVLLDECFLDFVIDGKEQSMIPRIRKYPNMFILKSFTKMFGIPGIRLGYGISANLDLLKKMEAVAQSWNVSHIAQVAGITACQMEGYEEQTAKEIAKLRTWMWEELKKLPLRVWEGNANYLFFQAPGCYDLHERCLSNGICLRHCDNYRGLGADYYRVAVKKQEENEMLMQILQRCLNE